MECFTFSIFILTLTADGQCLSSQIRSVGTWSWSPPLGGGGASIGRGKGYLVINYLNFEQLKDLKSSLMQKLKDGIDQPVPMVPEKREKQIQPPRSDSNVIHSLKLRWSLWKQVQKILRYHHPDQWMWLKILGAQSTDVQSQRFMKFKG